jgi:hypothetical protein
MIINEPISASKEAEAYAYLWSKISSSFYYYDAWLGLKDQVRTALSSK